VSPGSTPSTRAFSINASPDLQTRIPVSGAHRATTINGFTLVELLVVLVIVALISGVLLSAFERVLDIRVRLAAFLDGVEAPVLVADWFRSSVGGLLADSVEGRDRFSGGAHGMRGLSLAPLDAAAGVPIRITWTVTFEAAAGRSYLRYSKGDEPAMTIASWPGDYGGLRYCGANLVCHDSWPPDKNAAQLPALIRLDLIKGTEPWPVLAAPQGNPDTPQTASRSR
jgi:prepilin-type N-terminal cleavage/methylation domain-containing protein